MNGSSFDFGRGFWTIDPFQRGKKIDLLNKQNIPHNSRVIDRVGRGFDMVSHKSTDLRCKSYRLPSRIYSLGMGFVRELAAYAGETRCDHKVKATYYLHWALEHDGKRVLEWFVPHTGVSREQEAAIKRVVEKASDLGVTVVILTISD